MILESCLGKGIPGQGVLRRERDLLCCMPINLLLALYLVYPRYLFNMGPAYIFSRGVETLRKARILDPNTPDTWGTDYISSTDEVLGTPVGEEGPSEFR